MARVIMNLKELNEYVGHVHFEMDTLKDVRCDTLNPPKLSFQVY